MTPRQGLKATTKPDTLESTIADARSKLSSLGVALAAALELKKPETIPESTVKLLASVLQHLDARVQASDGDVERRVTLAWARLAHAVFVALGVRSGLVA